MAEPLDPIAAGVASALKSLRTRAGLTEDRLTETDLAFDALAGLATVQDLVAAGDSVEQAIARAVRAAARRLEPTDAIVADVILGLGLHPESLPDSGPYAGDLGRRRSSLLKNWLRLHELRSAPWEGPPPSLRALRFEIETRALSALAVALASAGSRPPVAGQTGQTARPLLTRSPVPLLLEEFRRIAGALRAALVSHEDGMGWPQDLRKGASQAPTPVSTSFGLRTMVRLEGSLAADLVPVVDFLRRQAAPGGGYAAMAQVAPRPEGTATVLDALHQIDGAEPFTAHVTSLKRGLGEFERTRPFILSVVLETSVRSGRDPGLTRMVAADLLAARRAFDGLLLWAQMAEVDLVAPVPSTAHTARAVRALVLAEAALAPEDELRAQVHEAIEQAGAWLARSQYLETTSESIDRQVGGRPEPVYVRHFTAAWAVKALVSLGLPASHPAVSAAVRRVWQEYHTDTALWRWQNGELPVWMTYDAVEALYLAAFAIPVPAEVFPPGAG
jgi:hypothetical protein